MGNPHNMLNAAKFEDKCGSCRFFFYGNIAIEDGSRRQLGLLGFCCARQKAESRSADSPKCWDMASKS